MDNTYIASIYKKLGMATEAEIVEKQAKTAAAIFNNLTFPQAQTLILVCMGVKISQESLNWLANISKDTHPGLATDGADVDVVVIALTVLREILKQNVDIAPLVVIAIEAASFGGKRECIEDKNFLGFAQEKLLYTQTVEHHISSLEELETSDLESSLDSIDVLAPQNNFSTAWASVRKAFEEIKAEHVTVFDLHNKKLQELIEMTKALEEQLQMQWFAISKWSKSANKPFVTLPVGEAVTRASYELAQLTQSTVGPASAPSLLHMVLSDSIAAAGDTNLMFVECCIAAPIVWRKSWVNFVNVTDNSKLTPILTAIGMASQANDEEDWQARFRREVGIDPNFEISPIGFALQLFHELLVIKPQE